MEKHPVEKMHLPFRIGSCKIFENLSKAEHSVSLAEGYMWGNKFAVQSRSNLEMENCFLENVPGVVFCGSLMFTVWKIHISSF